jgi:hypothetical protein
MSDVYDYKSYDDIPADTVDYILTVSKEDYITDCTLEEINEFMNALQEVNEWLARGDYKEMPRFRDPGY